PRHVFKEPPATAIDQVHLRRVRRHRRGPSQRAVPCFCNEAGPTEAVVGLLRGQRETRFLVQAAGRDEFTLRPEGDLPIPCLPGEADTFLDQARPYAVATGRRLDIEQSKLRDCFGLVDQKNRADNLAIFFSDPAPFLGWT